ncbi:MAG: four helix bundle protein [Gemmatimonadota bacterium]|nr:four helix bundle protein [Gemmatimonadota bacterium]
MNRHRRLRTWQSARELVRLIYKVTEALPVEEKYVASAQLRRAAWSVVNNIAEGNGKLGRAEMRRFFDTALGSLAEIDSMLATLAHLYPLESNITTGFEQLRRDINRGVFTMLKQSRKGP